MTLIKSIFIFFLICNVNITFAGNGIDKQYSKIVSAFNKKFPEEKISNIEKSPVKGIFEVIIPPHVYYTNSDATYVFSGDIFKLADEKNITQARRKVARKMAIDMLDPKSMIIYPAKKSKYVVTVFTDVDCAFCRKLHSQIDKYNDKGITIRYLAFPRGGVRAGSFKKSISVWCAKDKRKALTDAKNDIPIEEKSCESPVLEQYNLGKKFGIMGTPAIVLENGDVISGYVPPERLLTEIEKHLKKSELATLDKPVLK